MRINARSAPHAGYRVVRAIAACAIMGAGALGTISIPAAAQSSGTIAPPSREELAPPVRRDNRGNAVTLTIDGQMERRACALDNAEYADLRVTLSAITYTGSERAAEVALDRAHEGYLGRELPIRALCDIRDRAAALLDAAGYLAAVEIPAQSLGDGEAEMRVVLGRLVAVRARGDTEGAESTLAGFLSKLVEQDVFNVASAERYLLLANDIPGTQVRLSLRPADGGEPGDLVGEIAVQRERFVADFATQNLGSRSVGRYSGLARVEAYGLTGAGDSTSLLVYSTLDFTEQQTVQMAHNFLVGSEGLRLGGQVTLGWAKPDTLPGFTIESETIFATLDASYPFIRTQRFSLWGATGLDYVDQDVSINGFDITHDRVRTVFARMNFQAFDDASIKRQGGFSAYAPRQMLSGEVELRKGLDVLDATRDCRGAVLACTTVGAVPPTRIEQDPTPLFLRGNLTAQYRPVPEFGFSVNLRGQYTNTPVSSFEEFAGGNFTIGRGFDPASVLGDSGFGSSVEVFYGVLMPSAADAVAVQPFLFTDYAQSWQNDPSLRGLNPDQLWSAGGGLRFLRGNNLQGDFTVAAPLRRTDAQTRKGDVRVLFTLMARL